MTPRIPTELVLSVLSFCDGDTLVTCQQVCQHWCRLINHYDTFIWSPCCERDFQKGIRRKFWSLDFPDPQLVDTAMLSSPLKQPTLWQSLYRITRRWSLGHCTASFLSATSTASASAKPTTMTRVAPVTITSRRMTTDSTQQRPCVVVGTTQENWFFTTLSVTRSGHIVRSNPMYKGTTSGRQVMIVHDSFNPDDGSLSSFYLEDEAMHGIVCHYSHPISHWIVTGGLDGTVSLWNESQRCVEKTWQGHRGRVLCVSMNEQVVISGGSDSMIRVWELNDAEQRGSIDISSYLSDRQDWFQGVGEIALNGQLIVCAPDTSGPVLIFSLLTGSLVYELKTEPQEVVYTRLCLTPFYLLTKGEINSSNQHQVPIYPKSPSSPTSSPSPHTIMSLSSAKASLFNLPSSTSSLTPYQLSRYYHSLSSSLPSTPSASASTATSSSSPSLTQTTGTATRSCVDVWDLQTGKLAYRLVPPLPHNTIASITDIRISPNTAHIFACVEVRENNTRQNRLCCWDFSNQQSAPASIMALPSMSSLSSFGNAWACFY